MGVTQALLDDLARRIEVEYKKRKQADLSSRVARERYKNPLASNSGGGRGGRGVAVLSRDSEQQIPDVAKGLGRFHRLKGTDKEGSAVHVLDSRTRVPKGHRVYLREKASSVVGVRNFETTAVYKRSEAYRDMI